MSVLVLAPAPAEASATTTWVPTFLRSLRLATRAMSATSTVLATSEPTTLAAMADAFSEPGFAVRAIHMHSSPSEAALLRLMRMMLMESHATHGLLLQKAVGCIFQLPLSSLLSTTEPWSAGLRRGRSGTAATSRVMIVSRARGASDSVGHLTTALPLGGELSLSGGAACNPPPRLNAFGEVVNAVGAAYVALHDLELADPANCSWLRALSRRFTTAAPRSISLTAGRSLQKWRTQLKLDWWAQRHNNSRALSRDWPSLFPAPPPPREPDSATRPRRALPCAAARRQVLLTISNYQDPRFLYRWLRSLREGGASCEVVIFTDDVHNRAVAAVAARYGARLVRFIPTLPGVDPALMARFSNQMIKNFKFAILGQWLQKEGTAYELAGFLDVRDAYFQRDPFASIPCSGITAFSESAAIRLSARASIHRDHYERHCDTKFDSIAHFPPINSGGFFGDREAFIAIMRRCHEKVALCGKGYDQATFTEVLYQDARPATAVNLYTTEHGPVAHVSLSRSLQLDSSGTVLNEHGKPYAIVHQFDRFDHLQALVEARFPLDLRLAPLALSAVAIEASRKHDHKSTTARTAHG